VGGGTSKAVEPSTGIPGSWELDAALTGAPLADTTIEGEWVARLGRGRLSLAQHAGQFPLHCLRLLLRLLIGSKLNTCGVW
jgi:hypothetical protein